MLLHILLVWLLAGVALLATSRLVKGFEIKDFSSAMIASVVVGFLNATLKPILFILTLPINIITLGLFTFVVNAIILRLAAAFMKSFKIDGWWTAIVAAFVLMIVQILLDLITYT